MEKGVRALTEYGTQDMGFNSNNPLDRHIRGNITVKQISENLQNSEILTIFYSVSTESLY